MFDGTQTVDEDDGSDDEKIPMMADELGLGADEVIPFPYELHMTFGQELMNVFDTDILVIVNPGTGHMVKGAMSLHRWAICVCKTLAQKNLVQSELQKWVKSMHLIDLKDKPSKPDDVVQ